MDCRAGAVLNSGEGYGQDNASASNYPSPFPSQLVQEQSRRRFPGFYYPHVSHTQLSPNHQLYSLATQNPNRQAYYHNYQSSGPLHRDAYPIHKPSYEHQNDFEAYGDGTSNLEHQWSIDERYAAGPRHGHIMEGSCHIEHDLANHGQLHTEDGLHGEGHGPHDRASSGSLFLPSDDEELRNANAHSHHVMHDATGSPDMTQAQHGSLAGVMTRSKRKTRATRNNTASNVRTLVNRRLRSLSSQLTSPESQSSDLVGSRKSASTDKRKPADDPENRQIKYLHTVGRLDWPEIVVEMNKQRLAKGQEASFTEAAVYGRFKRNAPKIARLEGDTNFDVADWMYMRKRKNTPGLQIRGGRIAQFPAALQNRNTGLGIAPGDDSLNNPPTTAATDEDEILIRSLYEVISEDIWESVASKVHAVNGKPTSGKACEKHFKAFIEKVEGMSSVSPPQ